MELSVKALEKNNFINIILEKLDFKSLDACISNNSKKTEKNRIVLWDIIVKGIIKNGIDNRGYNKNGIDRLGYNRQGYNKEGFNILGFNKFGYDKEGFNKNNFDVYGNNKITKSEINENGLTQKEIELISEYEAEIENLNRRINHFITVNIKGLEAAEKLFGTRSRDREYQQLDIFEQDIYKLQIGAKNKKVKNYEELSIKLERLKSRINTGRATIDRLPRIKGAF